MKNYFIKIVTDIQIETSNDSVSSFIYSWFKDLPKSLHPDRFGDCEPVKRKITEEGMQAVIDCWRNSGFSVLLKRSKNPKFMASGSFGKKSSSDPFPSYYSVWLDAAAGDDLALTLFRFLVKHLEPVYGTISSRDSYTEKHLVTYPIVYPNGGTARAEKYVGMSVGDTLPGIHWVTFLGQWSIEKLGRQKLTELPVHKIENLNNGLLIFAYKGLWDVDRETAAQLEREIQHQLGIEHFFDKRMWRPENSNNHWQA